MALILQLIIIWLVGILFESGVDDCRTYRQVAGSWVCSWWVTTVVNKGLATLETVVWIQNRFNTNSSSEITQNFRLVSLNEFVWKRPITLYFFYVRFRSFSLVSSEAPTTMRSHQSNGRTMADCVIIAWFSRFTSLKLALYLIIIPKIACIQSWASQALRMDNFSNLWCSSSRKKNNMILAIL